jgi:hypothetical protein
LNSTIQNYTDTASEFDVTGSVLGEMQYEDFNNNFQPNVEDEFNLFRSVSMTFLENARSREEYHQSALKSYIEPYNRNKMFNCSFKLYKKRDIVPSVDNYKCGQSFECLISYIQDSMRFYVQKTSRLKDLEHLEECIKKYASILIEDCGILEELYTFQERSAINDVVLVKAAWDNKWHRAIFIGNVRKKK